MNDKVPGGIDGDLRELYEILGRAEDAVHAANNNIAVLKGKIGLMRMKLNFEGGGPRRGNHEKTFLEELLNVSEINGVDVMERNGENGPTIVSAYGYDVGDIVAVKGVVVHEDGVMCTTHPIGEVVGFTPGKVSVEVELNNGESEIIIMGAEKIEKISTA